jgi:CheY-like chemotaxis protein/signal transduction histidine kinase
MGETAADPVERAHILVVDDNADNRLTLESILAEPGQQVVTAASGRDALRRLLEQEFAVILLDVNMPGMDGFETASLVRQRKSSERTPIIFITAFSDDVHVARGYSLGAVDYIVSPVVPEILRSKVAVFVDLFRKTEQVRRQAESLRRRADQLSRLTEASLAINSVNTLDEILEIVTETARELLGARCCLTVTRLEQAHRAARPPSFAQAGVEECDHRSFVAQAAAMTTRLADQSRTVLVTPRELAADPRWRLLLEADEGENAGGAGGPSAVGGPSAAGGPSGGEDGGAGGGAVAAPRPAAGSRRGCGAAESGWLAAPLTGRDGRCFGWVHLAGREGPDCEFGAEDRTILTQLAQVGSIAIENTLSSEAREANRLKDEFLTTLSHELRTPLTAILGWTRVLRTSPPDEVRLGHGLEVIERNVTSQAKLIEDLLDVSRIIAGKLRVSLRPIPLLASIEAAVEGMRPAAEIKGVALRLHVAPDVDHLAAISGDPDRLQQVGWNLVSNAIKFTPAGGSIEVAVSRQANAFQLRVSDTGKGISPHFLQHVFDRFRQDDSSSTRAHGGLGIGLAIVHSIVEQHGGRVTAESPGPNLGATFTVVLPALPDGAAAAVEELLPPPGAAAAAGAARHGQLERLRLLVVDDEPDTREILSEVLRSAGAEVATAASLGEALADFDRFRPDVVISDIAMPGGDGYALIRQLRRRGRERGGGVPAIAVSAHAREEDRRRALSAGFARYVTKPVEPAELLAVVREIAPARRVAVRRRAVAEASDAAGPPGPLAGGTTAAVVAGVALDTVAWTPAAPGGRNGDRPRRPLRPLRRAAAPARDQGPAAVDGVEPLAGGADEAAGGRRILLVEDDPDSRDALKTLLELSGHQVAVAADGGEAVAHVIANRPDVALVDIGLPEIDGNEVARRIRAHLGAEGIFLVALTGYGDEADEAVARAAGFDAHFTKPVELTRLERLLRTSSRAPRAGQV